MAKDPFSIRVSEEVQEKFKEFAESGEFRNQGEFFTHLLTLYAAQEISIKVPTLEGAITAVTDMADRVCKILIGTGETITVNHEKLKDETEAWIEAQRLENNEKIKAFISENESLKEKNAQQGQLISEQQQLTESIKRSLIETQERIKDLENNLNDKTALNIVYFNKISSLETEIENNETFVTKAADSLTELETLRFTVKELNLRNDQNELEREKALGELEKALRNEMTEQQARHTAVVNEYENRLLEQERSMRNEITEQLARHTATVNDYEKKLLEQEKAQLDHEKALRNEMGEQQNKYAASVTVYENKVKALLDEFERRPIAPTANS